MPDTTLEAVKAANTDLIFKALDAVVLVAPMSAAIPATFTTGATAALQELPTDYRSIGLVTKDDGYTWGRDTDVAETTSHGVNEPTRRDINSDVSTLQMTAQQTSRLTLELSNNVDLSAVTPAATTGEISFKKPSAPSTRFWRVVSIARDGAGTDLRYLITIFPKAMISEYGESVWSDENELVYPLTWTATLDPDYGSSVGFAFAGPGIKSRLEAMGFPAAL